MPRPEDDHPSQTTAWQQIERANAKHYKAEGTITEVVEYDGRAHLMPSQEGWEEVADYALAWAVDHASTRAVTPSGVATE